MPLACQQCLCQVPQIAQRPLAIDGQAEQFGQLADQHGEGDAVHVAVADRLGQQFGDEAQAQQPGDHAERPGHQGHHAGDGDGPLRVAGGVLHHHGQDRRGQCRVRAQHEDAAGAEQGVGQQWDDGRVEAVDTRYAGGFGVGDAHGHEHGGEHQAGSDVLGQPGALVVQQGDQAGQPALPVEAGARWRFRHGEGSRGEGA
ncbi:hypothetical protein D3C79_569810 [compost metagenome]